MHCEQTLNNLPHLVVEENSKITDVVSDGVSRRTILEHLRTCQDCQREYEALWNTANMLESVDEPVVPPELAGNIQQHIRELHQQKQLAFFANPLAWCLNRLKLDISPRLVNATALLFFLIASGFIMKLAFFTHPPEPQSGLIAMKKSMLQNIKISTSPWAGLKDVEIPAEDGRMSQGTAIDPKNTYNHFFSPTSIGSKVWHTDYADANRQTGQTSIAGYSRDAASEKLTVFWNQIKTEL